ncbi:radical SAM protein [Lamprobacter modestohalophilus]|uniref:B12-binding domain-containing radical SAM protein n=1 Tax=Lamprobacter modestohalophilus TaxID=1064514 RepID=UPI002ADEB7B7|nr:radical SAM protein [Lamprobacter modestohalophilus]MEA1052771.1 radical SAM protein [Lamprobacter modestohalophilus]
MNINSFYKNLKRKEKRLNFLYVVPRFVNSIGDGYAFPLGLACESASMKAAGFKVSVINLNHIEGDIHNILSKEIEKNCIDVVCTGGISLYYSVISIILRSVKKYNSNIVTIVGGGMVTAEPNVAMEALGYADYGVIGEGEITICELAFALENSFLRDDIPGIVFKKGDTWQVTKKRDEIRDLDDLPMPDYEGFDLHTHLTLPPTTPMYNEATKRMAFVEGSRSCPYKCTFCFNTTGNRYRQRSLESILKEVRYLQEHYNVQFIYMVDELFATKFERVKVFNYEMKRLNIAWTCAFRVDNITPELVNELKDGTFAYMLLGLESADDSVLKSMNKKVTVSQIEKALQLGFDAGIHCGGNFIFGDIAETYETALNTLNWWKRNSKYNISLTFITPYPGTNIYKDACEKKIIRDPVKYLKNGCPEVNISKMSDYEMGIIAKEIFVAPYKYSEQINDFSYEMLSNGRAKCEGKCCSCGSVNIWSDMPLSMLFASNRRLQCKKCGQKHVMPIIDQLKNSVVDGIKNLDPESRSIGLWGITHFSVIVFDELTFFNNPNLVFIDNAFPKQKMIINKKKVYSPDVLHDERIETVVVFYPNLIKVIEDQVFENYGAEKNIVNVCDLIFTV